MTARTRVNVGSPCGILTQTGGEEVLEAVGGEMEILRKTEYPDTIICNSLFETIKCGARSFGVDLVAEETVVCELPLVLVEPLGGEWSVGQEPRRDIKMLSVVLRHVLSGRSRPSAKGNQTWER